MESRRSTWPVSESSKHYRHDTSGHVHVENNFVQHDLDQSLKSNVKLEDIFQAHGSHSSSSLEEYLHGRQMRIEDLEKNNGTLQREIKKRDNAVAALQKKIKDLEDHHYHQDAGGGEIELTGTVSRDLQQRLHDFASEDQKPEARRSGEEEKPGVKSAVNDAEIGHAKCVKCVKLRDKNLAVASQLWEFRKKETSVESKVRDLEIVIQEKDSKIAALTSGLTRRVSELDAKNRDFRTLQVRLKEHQLYVQKLQAKIKETEENKAGSDLEKEKLSSKRDKKQQAKDIKRLGIMVTVPDKNKKGIAEVENLGNRLKVEQEKVIQLNQTLQQRDCEIAELRRRNQDPRNVTFRGEDKHAKECVGGESFLESEATPFLLDGAVQRVHEAASVFVRFLIKAVDLFYLDSSEVARVHLPRFSQLGKPAPLKYVYEAILCELMFSGFEHEYYGIYESTTSFLDPEQHRKDNFRQYQDLRSAEDPETLLLNDNSFSDFCRAKFTALSRAIPDFSNEIDGIRDYFLGHPDSAVVGFTCDQNDLGLRLGITFLKLAQCVWQVHKLAFSFYPIARVFRVPELVDFIDKHMESVVIQEAEGSDQDDSSPGWIPKVGFMVVPGFLLNRIVVRSRVFVLAKPAG